MESQSARFSPVDEHQHPPLASSPSASSLVSLFQHQSQQGQRQRQTGIITHRKELKIRVAEFLSSTSPKIEAEKTKFEFPLVDIKSKVRYFEAEIEKVNEAVRKLLRQQASTVLLKKEKRRLRKEWVMRSMDDGSDLNAFPQEGHELSTEFIDQSQEDFSEEIEISPEKIIYHPDQFRIFDWEETYLETDEEDLFIYPMKSETKEHEAVLKSEAIISQGQSTFISETLPIRPMTTGSLNTFKSLKNVKALLENLNRKWEMRAEKNLEEKNGVHEAVNQNESTTTKLSTENLHQLKKVLAILDLLDTKYVGNDNERTGVTEVEGRHDEAEAYNVGNENEASGGLMQRNESMEKLEQLKRVAVLLDELHQKCENQKCRADGK